MGKWIIHQRRRTNKKNIPNGYVVDHIIPYCISEDDSEENLQIIKKSEHNKKTGKDRRAINMLKKEGYIESVSRYALEIKKPREEVIKKFLEIKEFYDRIDRIDSNRCSFYVRVNRHEGAVKPVKSVNYRFTPQIFKICTISTRNGGVKNTKKTQNEPK